MKLSLILASILVLSTSSFANDTSDIAELKQQVKELQEMSQTLIDETSDLKTGFNYTTVDTTKSFSGLGAAASKIYYSKSPLSIGGYGEMYYSRTSQSDGTTSSKVDVYRFVPYIGYKFSDNIILNTELEFEHGGSKDNPEHDNGGYVIVEFMYLDFLINKNVNFRVGNLLVPMGLINERHEPTLFNTVQRPYTSKYLIPSTWHESGAMVFGNITENLSYKIAGVVALNPTDGGKKWLRKGRTGSLTKENPDLGGVLRVDYTGITGLLIGASTYSDADILMLDAHVDYKYDGARVYGVYSQSSRSNVSASDGASGGFLNVSYDVLSTSSSEYSLPLFVQYESVNPQSSVSGSGVSYNPVNTTTVGANFFPQKQVVLKVDYAIQDNNFDEDTTISKISSKTLSVSMGFIF